MRLLLDAPVLLWALSAVGENPECHVPSPSARAGLKSRPSKKHPPTDPTDRTML
jgi:hypothetical protein